MDNQLSQFLSTFGCLNCLSSFTTVTHTAQGLGSASGNNKEDKNTNSPLHILSSLAEYKCIPNSVYTST